MHSQAIIPKLSLGSKFFSVEGNIGSGKSTFLRRCDESSLAKIIYEPCALWQNVAGHNLLDAFYKDMNRWAYSFQTYTFLTRINALEKIFDQYAHEKKIFFSERSTYADRLCFGRACHEAGFMSDLEWHMYVSWYDWFVGRHVRRPHGVIYLRVTPEISFERIKKRSRSEEVGISFDYLSRLHDLHEEWIIKKENIPLYLKDIPVLVLDCDKEFENDDNQWKVLEKEIRNFIEISDLVAKSVCMS